LVADYDYERRCASLVDLVFSTHLLAMVADGRHQFLYYKNLNSYWDVSCEEKFSEEEANQSMGIDGNLFRIPYPT
jgi:hypothetical protein